MGEAPPGALRWIMEKPPSFWMLIEDLSGSFQAVRWPCVGGTSCLCLVYVFFGVCVLLRCLWN